MSVPPDSLQPDSVPEEDLETLALTAWVLQRDSTKTDYIVIPFAAGILARLVLALETGQMDNEINRSEWPDIRARAQRMLDFCSEDQDSRWADEVERYTEVFSLVTIAWETYGLWLPANYAEHKHGKQTSSRGPVHLENSIAWLRENPAAPLLDMMLVAQVGTVGAADRRGNHPLLSRPSRPIRVELAKRIRAEGLTTWPQIIRMAVAAWTFESVERLGFDLAAVAHAALEFADKVVTVAISREEKATQEPPVPPLTPSEAEAAAAAARAAETIAAQTVELRDVSTQNRILTQRLVAAEAQRDALANRDARAESRAVSLTHNLAVAQQRTDDLAQQLRNLTRERDDLAAQVSVEESLALGAPPLPADALAGRKVLLFTGHAAADVREVMRKSFFEYGTTDVTCYWTDKSLGLDRVPSDAILVVDVTFMSHTKSDAVVALARKSGAWCCLSRRGTAMLAREVVARLVALEHDSAAHDS